MRDSWLGRRGLLKSNYRGEEIPTAAGFLLLAGTAAGWVAALFLEKVRPDLLFKFIYLAVLAGAAGLVDDLAGNKEHQGFSGHLQAALQGGLTTGVFKAAAVTAAGVLVLLPGNTAALFILDLILLLLLTNLLNLFDLRPGRALKFFLLMTLPLLPSLFYYLAPLYLTIFIYLPYELKGQVMLGDTGANALGALAGLGYVMVLNLPSKVLLILLAAGLTLLSEFTSFSRIISGNGILDWLDRLGRPRY